MPENETRELLTVTQNRIQAYKRLLDEVRLGSQRIHEAIRYCDERLQELVRLEALGDPSLQPRKGPGRVPKFTQRERDEYIVKPYCRDAKACYEEPGRKPQVSVRSLARQLGVSRQTVQAALARWQRDNPLAAGKVNTWRHTRACPPGMRGAPGPRPIARAPSAPDPRGNVWDQDLERAMQMRQDYERRRLSADAAAAPSAPSETAPAVKRTLEEQAFDDASLFGDGDG